MEKKKPTNAQLQAKLKNAIVFVPKDKDTKSIYFDDKGVRITVTSDYCVVSTNFHSHVFDRVTSNGYSRPYLYLSTFLDIATTTDCNVKDEQGNVTYSYAKLFKNIENDKESSIVAKYVDWYLYNIFAPLYSIDDNKAGQYFVFFDYVHNIVKNSIILEEHKEGLTNKQFLEQYKEKLDESISEEQLFVPMSDEEFAKQEMEAMHEQELEEVVK